jgi:hypothetical protein
MDRIIGQKLPSLNTFELETAENVDIGTHKALGQRL